MGWKFKRQDIRRTSVGIVSSGNSLETIELVEEHDVGDNKEGGWFGTVKLAQRNLGCPQLPQGHLQVTCCNSK